MLGYIQVFIILVAARYLFGISVEGSIILLLLSTPPFMGGNLSVDLTFYSIVKN
ncbi:hypothetical protein [Coxiella-like endosymbiont]|uniref:hypothetical protein n=1 Tax=Coxiella-like endosymbiont TaxID=1592897 RepID=UPI002729BF73|nr:hypothetical protein [Coxiella-like endosymbiont]